MIASLHHKLPCLLPFSKGVVRLEISHQLWPVHPFVIIFTLTSGSSCVILLLCCLLFLALLEGRVCEYVSQELCPSKGIGERQVTLWCVIIQLPYELIREGPVVELLHFSVQLLHPADLDEKASEVASRLLPQPPLHAVPKLAIAMLPPERVNGAEVLCGDELDLREENISSTACRLARKVDEERTGGLISLAVISLCKLAA